MISKRMSPGASLFIKGYCISMVEAKILLKRIEILD